MQTVLQEAFARAFAFASNVNLGLVAIATLALTGLLLAVVATVTKDRIKPFVERYLATVVMFGVMPLLAYAYAYYWTLGVLFGLGLVTGVLALRIPWFRSRTWIPALVAAIPFLAVAWWEEGYLEAARINAQPPTVAVLMFDNRSLTAQQQVIENAWKIFADKLNMALQPVQRIVVQPLKAERDKWHRINLDNALDQLKALGVYPDVIIVTNVNPGSDRITMRQAGHIVTDGASKFAFPVPAETSGIDEYEQLALRQVLTILPKLKGDVALSEKELETACAVILQDHLATLPAGSPAAQKLQPHAGTCPGVPVVEAILREALVPGAAGEDHTVETANRETAAAVLNATLRGDE